MGIKSGISSFTHHMTFFNQTSPKSPTNDLWICDRASSQPIEYTHTNFQNYAISYVRSSCSKPSTNLFTTFASYLLR
jgi:hypothetical protein